MNLLEEADVIIIGAGLSGLSAAVRLQQKGKSVKVLEASDRPGGRVKTDKVEGFLLDRGFQVLLTAYPETREMLDYDALKLKPFLPGAMIMNEEGMFEVSDPSRVPTAILKTIFAKIGTVSDKIRMLWLRERLQKKTVEEIFAQPEITTLAAIQEYGFSEKMLRNFFRPFFAGIFLEDALTTSRREFDFVFKMFSEGDTSVPEQGMEMIPRQLADRLKPGTIQCNKKVQSIEGQRVVTTEGEEFTAPLILLATEPNTLTESYAKKNTKQSTTNVYLTADKSPLKKPIIALDAIGSHLVNNVCVMNNVSPAYAPAGKHLISVSFNGLSVTSDEELVLQIKDELFQWFGEETYRWNHLKTYRIEYALPGQEEVRQQLSAEDVRLREGLYGAGDYLLNGSISGALRSGMTAADVIASEMVSA